MRKETRRPTRRRRKACNQGGWKKPALIAVAVLLVIGIIGSFGEGTVKKDKKEAVSSEKEPKTEEKKKEEKRKPSFKMKSTDTLGVETHILVGDKKEPTGHYEIVCTKGHGVVTIGDSGYPLAADEFQGQEMGSETYKETASAQIEMSTEIKARNYNSSDFEVEFFLIEE